MRLGIFHTNRLGLDLMSNFTNVNECRSVVFLWVLLWAVFDCLLYLKMCLHRVNAVSSSEHCLLIPALCPPESVLLSEL